MLEIIGLFLAIIDFCDLTNALATKVNLGQLKIEKLATSAFDEYGPFEVFYRWCVGICFVVHSIYLFHKLSDGTLPSQDVPWPLRVLLALLVSAIATLFYGLALILVIFVIYFFALLPLVFILRLLAKPKKGIVGSIGLLLAIVGVIVRFSN